MVSGFKMRGESAVKCGDKKAPLLRGSFIRCCYITDFIIQFPIQEQIWRLFTESFQQIFLKYPCALTFHRLNFIVPVSRGQSGYTSNGY